MEDFFIFCIKTIILVLGFVLVGFGYSLYNLININIPAPEESEYRIELENRIKEIEDENKKLIKELWDDGYDYENKTYIKETFFKNVKSGILEDLKNQGYDINGYENNTQFDEEIYKRMKIRGIE